MLDISLDGIKDPVIRDAFYTILEEFRTMPILNYHWEFFSVTFPAAVTNYKFKHNLGFTPKDFLITGITGLGTAFFDLDESDETFLDITASNACTVRFLLGNLDVRSTA